MVSASNMGLFKSPKFKKAGSYLMELLIVVVGVSIAFQLNVWNDTRKENVQERYLLQNFIAEHDLNRVEIDSSILALEYVLKANPALIELLNSPQLAMDSIKQKLAILYRISWPDISSTHLNNYLEFTSANTELKEEMLVLKSHYASVKELIRVYIDQKQEKYFDYLADVVDLTNGLKVVNKEKLLSVKLKNNLLIVYFYEDALLSTYKKITTSQKKIAEIIERQIGK
jgi:hypothetical protein